MRNVKNVLKLEKSDTLRPVVAVVNAVPASTLGVAEVKRTTVPSLVDTWAAVPFRESPDIEEKSLKLSVNPNALPAQQSERRTDAITK
jgi:hypothetical protein